MRFRAHIHRSNSKWSCFWGYFIGLGNTLNKRGPTVTSSGPNSMCLWELSHEPEATKRQLRINLRCPV